MQEFKLKDTNDGLLQIGHGPDGQPFICLRDISNDKEPLLEREVIYFLSSADIDSVISKLNEIKSGLANGN